eukprot:6869332-Prymnesium_polylepis.2
MRSGSSGFICATAATGGGGAGPDSESSTQTTPAVSSSSENHWMGWSLRARKQTERMAVSSSFDWYNTWNVTISMLPSAT